MTKIYFGCDEIPRHWDHYFERCNALELDLTQLDNPPKIKTLNRWRVESPRGFAFVLRVDRDVERAIIENGASSEWASSDALRKAWQKTLDSARALAAKALLFKTPLSFSPGQTARSVIEDFAREFAAQFKGPVIWEARGMWDTESTRSFASQLGLTYAYDPFLAIRDEIGLSDGDGAFILSERAGMRREFDRYDIRGLLDRLGSYNRVFFLLRGRFQWEHASHFAELTGHRS